MAAAIKSAGRYHLDNEAARASVRASDGVHHSRNSQDEYEVEQHSGSSGSSTPESPHPTRDIGHKYIALHQSSTTPSAVPAPTCALISAPLIQSAGSHAPVPLGRGIERLPKLEHDSEREFTDLKMALDYLLGPHPQLSEYYKYQELTVIGPYLVKVGRRNEKRWGLIFKCLTMRCVHLDLINSLDTDTFLLALRRFIARRGTPSEIYSDQGTNFRGAERELKEAFADIEPQLQKSSASHQIIFRFNPPASPHFGGIWEREIRSVKRALQVVIGAQAVPEDVLLTVLIEVEGILNAKPLRYVSSDVADPDPVTPSMLLMGRRDASLPQVSYVPDALTRRRWRQSQMIADHFWSRFIKGYLPTLQVRQKWRIPTSNLEIGPVVMIVDPQLQRALWPVGKIVNLNVSEDGYIRAAELKVNNQTYLRPVAQLV
ncbi:hypothetical protein D4764_12G0007520 [Takifugu flavidus]|uniref:Integrase catalytic domain-containing protein n=1 Tax=Takifugu flavidus TaxID=433684 RepID=A0A5C6PC41_9TELE|nr:hypothetical protein D4764_12G0007520 [Takifugu flavidus]